MGGARAPIVGANAFRCNALKQRLLHTTVSVTEISVLFQARRADVLACYDPLAPPLAGVA